MRRLNLSWSDLSLKAWTQSDVPEGDEAGKCGATGHEISDGKDKKQSGDPEPPDNVPTAKIVEPHNQGAYTGVRFGIGVVTQVIAVDLAKLKREHDLAMEREKAKKLKKKTDEEIQAAKHPW